MVSKLIAGGREVAHVTDSGSLNVAKQLLSSPTTNPLTVQAPDFAYSGLPPGQPISLYTYNRCVGQALLVALNAQASGTATAATDATNVFTQLQAIGTDLTNQVQGGSSYQSAFSFIAQQTNTRMLGNNQVQAPGYATAFMKGGTSKFSTTNASANIYFYSDQLAQAQLNLLPFNTSSLFQPGIANATSYILGYQMISVPLSSGTLKFLAVPTFPQQMPHLVSPADFGNCKSSPDPNNATPPNAISVQSKVAVSNSSAFAGALACAIVGSVDVGYAASFPAGYIEVFNRPGWWPAGPAPWDMSSSIFDNEMYGTPGVSLVQLPNGMVIFSCAPSTTGSQSGTAPFGPGPTLIDDWATYNTSGGTQPPVTNNNYLGLGYQGTKAADANIYIATSQSSPAHAATLPIDLLLLQQIKSPNYLSQTQNNCMSMLVSNGWLTTSPVDCLDWMPCIAATYGEHMPDGTQEGPLMSTLGSCFSNVDNLKMSLMYALGQSRIQALTLNAPNTPTYSAPNSYMNGSTGMGCFARNGSYSQTSPPAPVSIWPSPAQAINQMPVDPAGTPWQYLSQINYETNGSCSGAVNSTYPYSNTYPTTATAGTVFAAIYQRCKQIQPSVTATQVAQLLDSTTLPMGAHYYIYLPNADQTSTQGPIGDGLVLNAGPPPAFNGTSPQLPDGQPLTTTSLCVGQYPLVPDFINTQTISPQGYPQSGQSPTLVGDLNLNDQIYNSTQVVNGSQPLTGMDYAAWQDSSGAGNLLGHLEFINTVTGAASFSTP